VLIPPLAELAAAYESIAAPIRRAPVVAIMLNTRTIADEQEARDECARVEGETGRVCDDPVRFGAERLWKAVAGALPPR
jgi:uncharacterized NAD-dependent epimerase/dehydratase family protein